MKIADIVEFTGALSSPDTLAEIAASDALLQHAVDSPGGPEAFTVTITEAMAHGKPVFATWCGGIPDQVINNETGFLVSHNDIGAMTRSMALLANDTALCHRMGAAGRARAKKHFDAQVLARRAEDILLRAAENQISG